MFKAKKVLKIVWYPPEVEDIVKGRVNINYKEATSISLIYNWAILVIKRIVSQKNKPAVELSLKIERNLENIYGV
jgi:hypothetical protein